MCPVVRCQHRHVLSHVIHEHPEIAKSSVRFPCFECKRGFANAKTLAAHQTGHKRRANGAAGAEEKAADSEEGAPEAKRVKTEVPSCCGFEFSGRKWNYDRHFAARHSKGSICHTSFSDFIYPVRQAQVVVLVGRLFPGLPSF